MVYFFFPIYTCQLYCVAPCLSHTQEFKLQHFAGAGDAGMIIPLSTHTLHALGTTGATGQIIALQA